MKSFWNWLAIKVIGSLSTENLDRYVFGDLAQRINMCVSGLYVINSTDILLVNVPETLNDSEIAALSSELKKVIPSNRCIIVATDSPIKIVRFQ
jgi:hypothetical protein